MQRLVFGLLISLGVLLLAYRGELIREISDLLTGIDTDSSQPVVHPVAPKRSQSPVIASSSWVRNAFQIPLNNMPTKISGEWPVPEWLTKRQTKIRAQLGVSAPFDVLVVPAQVSGIADMASRRYYSGVWQQRLEANGKKVVPVTQARWLLGLPMRDYADDAVYQLADKLQVSEIYWLYLGDKNAAYYWSRRPAKNVKGHAPQIDDPDLPRQIDFRVVRQERQAGGGWLKTGSSVQFEQCQNLGDDDYRIVAFEFYARCIEPLAQTFGLHKRPGTLLEATPVSETMLRLGLPLVASDRPDLLVAQAYYEQLLALLTPYAGYPPVIKQRFIDKSHFILNKLHPDSADYRLLKARALYYSHLRPLALKTLNDSKNSRERAFVAFMQENLPALHEELQKIESGPAQVLASIEYFDLVYRLRESFTGQDLKDINQLIKRYPALQFELSRRIHDRDLWRQFSNVDLKLYLDNQYPIAQTLALDMARFELLNGSRSEFGNELEKLYASHLATLEQSTTSTLATIDEVTQEDHLLLLEAIGDTNLLRQIKFQQQVQGNMHRSEALHREYAAIIGGHPESYRLQEQFQSAMTGRTAGVEKQHHQQKQKAITMRKRAYYEISDGMVYHGRDKFRWYDGSIDSYGLLLQAELEAVGVLNRDILDDFESRFIGSPKKAAIEVMLAKKTGDEQLMDRIMANAIKEHPESWDNIWAYANRKLHQGKYDEIDAILTVYPEFSNPAKTDSRVGLSNHAYSAGNLLYNLGLHQQAQKYYKISAELNTGSGSGERARAKLRLMDNDFAGAYQTFYDNASHYNNPYDLAMALGLLGFVGDVDTARSLTQSVLVKMHDKRLLDTLLDLYRSKGIGKEEFCQWVEREVSTQSGLLESGLLHQFAYSAMTTDRDLSTIDKSDNWLSCLATSTGATTEAVSQYYQLILKHKIAVFTGDLETASETYNTAKRISRAFENYPGSKSRFVLQMHSPDYWPLRLLQGDNYANIDYHFGDELGDALKEAYHGHHEQALDLLEAGWGRGLTDKYQPNSIDRYELVSLESAEWLWNHYQQIVYRDYILERARHLQVAEPFRAWPHALVAKYSSDPEEQRQALGMAYRLDRDSNAISGFSLVQKKQAKKWVEDNWQRLYPQTKSNKVQTTAAIPMNLYSKVRNH